MLRGMTEHVFIHNGQKYDFVMARYFFDELELPLPDYSLEMGSGSPGWQLAQLFTKLEATLIRESPDMVMVYGDSTSTLAAGLVASRLNIPVAHVEAGCRSFDKSLAEEVNRVSTDHLSSLLFCPTDTSVTNLQREGIGEGVHQVGDVMYDTLLECMDDAEERSTILEKHDLQEDEYYLVDIHHSSNTDTRGCLSMTVELLLSLEMTIFFPIHPRVSMLLKQFDLMDVLNSSGHIKILYPLGYHDFLKVLKNCNRVLTDTGCLQKDAYFLKKPCITLRDETEWPETLEGGWNTLTGLDLLKIREALDMPKPKTSQKKSFGEGKAGEKVRAVLEEIKNEMD